MKGIIISIGIVVLLIGGAVFFGRGSATNTNQAPVNNVSMEGDKQIISISAKGGYSPRISVAKAGIPTILRLETRGTYDCSSAFTIPSMGYRKNLPPTGITEVEIPAQKSGAKFQGLCSMGMYSFAVNFE
jgi:plastocyanin domain-containing protein